ncbi:histone-lysine N-methyltransferase SUV39H2-like [Erethizon dorsatum]
MEYYLVKWKGWPDSTNTWEPLQNLKCPLLLQQFFNDMHNYLSQVKKSKAIIPKDNNKTLKPAIARYIVKKAKQRIALQKWQDELNRRKNHKGMIFVENTVDLEGPPTDFYYVNKYKPAPGISLVNEVTLGCSCTDCFFEKCCPTEAGVALAYNKNQQIKIPPGTPIYECNSRCLCGPDCPNRIVQKGTQYSLCIFRTSNGCGWGVKTLVKIKRMSFVMEYVGEVITSEEAERRGQLYDNKGITYLFDQDYESEEFTVDAARYGNVSHFVNHSQAPWPPAAAFPHLTPHPLIDRYNLSNMNENQLSSQGDCITLLLDMVNSPTYARVRTEATEMGRFEGPRSRLGLPREIVTVRTPLGFRRPGRAGPGQRGAGGCAAGKPSRRSGQELPDAQGGLREPSRSPSKGAAAAESALGLPTLPARQPRGKRNHRAGGSPEPRQEGLDSETAAATRPPLQPPELPPPLLFTPFIRSEHPSQSRLFPGVRRQLGPTPVTPSLAVPGTSWAQAPPRDPQAFGPEPAER